MPFMLMPEDMWPCWVVCIESGGVLRVASVTRHSGDVPSEARVMCGISGSLHANAAVRCEQIDPLPLDR